MFDRTRAKAVCVAVEDYGQSEKIVLQLVYEGPLGPNMENRRFHQASPWGKFELTIDNPALRGFYKKDGYYYIETTPAPVDGDG